MEKKIAKIPVLKIHPRDNVIVALQDLPKGSIIFFENSEYELLDNISAKHKFFTENLDTGDAVFMYGVLVGKTQQAVKRGNLMSTSNVKHAAEPYFYRSSHYKWVPPDISKFVNRTFNGYRRSDGRTGTANYWLFIPTVFCENRNLDVIREALHNELGYAVTDKYKQFTRQLREAYEQGADISDEKLFAGGAGVKTSRTFKNIDGIKFLNHQGGCGGTRQDAAVLSALLAAYADHPNVGGITMLSLGCQHLQVADFLHDLKKRNPHFQNDFLFSNNNSRKVNRS